MKKSIRIIVVTGIILLLVFLYAHIGRTNIIYDADVDTSDYKTTAIFINEIVSQEFECPEKYMDGIKLKCKLSGDVQEIEVYLTLVDGESGEILAEQVVAANELEESKFYLFSFDRIEKCDDKKFILNITEKNAMATDFVDFCFTDGQEKNTKMFLDNEQCEGTLVMKTVTNCFDFETFCVLFIFVAYVVVFMNFLYRLFR